MNGLHICSFDNGHYRLEVCGEEIRFEWSELFGPTPITKTNAELHLRPRHPFWWAATLWAKQGKRAECGVAIWHYPKPPVTKHIVGNNYRIIEPGEDGWETGEQLKRMELRRSRKGRCSMTPSLRSELERLEKEATEHVHLGGCDRWSCAACLKQSQAELKLKALLRNNVSSFIAALKERDELREAIRKLDPLSLEWRNEDGDIACCHCMEIYRYGSGTIEHRPDCPWLKSQLSERQEKQS